MYSSKHHCGFVLNNEDYLEGVATENKIPTSNPQAQLLSNMQAIFSMNIYVHVQQMLDISKFMGWF